MIRDALHEEDAALYERVAGEQSWLQGALSLFRGRSRWLANGTAASMLALTVVAVLMEMEFFQATQTRGMLIWGAGFMICLAAGIGLKIFAWIDMSKKALMREIKRLELQVAYLATRQDLSNEEKF